MVVIGAGPIGIAAAFELRQRDHEVVVLEADDVGHALMRWGNTRFFSPLGMNVPRGFRRVLGSRMPPDDALLTGPEMVERVLAPVAASPALTGCVRAHHRVVAVGRAGMLRGDHAGHPLRGERPFQLLVETSSGEQRFDADVVLDASGASRLSTFLGAGGLPAQGERALADRLVRDLGRFAERLPSFPGRRVLLVGHGHSAATAALALAGLAAAEPSTRVIWAVRSAQRRPVLEVCPDPLPERRRVASSANDLAADPPAFLDVRRRTSVERLEARSAGIRVRFSGGDEDDFDAVVALTGFRPDLSFVSELALEISPATEGAARLSRALRNVTDCLSVPAVSAGDLESGEPGFYFVGAKSYGRGRTFLLRTGLAHLGTILSRAVSPTGTTFA